MTIRLYEEWLKCANKTTFLNNLDEMALDSLVKCEAHKVYRKAKYPPMEDYLDAVVKNDEAAIQAYISKCLAIKQKYPKVELG